MISYRFPEQNILQPDTPFSEGLMAELLARISTPEKPLTGYLRFTEESGSLHFLFFLAGAPYAAGRYAGGRPVSYSIHELCNNISGENRAGIQVALCQTDPVLLKSMLLFLQEDPAIKAPNSFIDLEYIVRQIGSAGRNALITLAREERFNFFFFKDGVAALAHYADEEFDRPSGMTVDEEMLLYAFQPEARVEVYVFRNMVTAEASDAAELDCQSLLQLLVSSENVSAPGRTASQLEPGAEPAVARQKLPSVTLTVKNGAQEGEKFVVTLPCSIGRKDCDMILADGQISRRHAELKIVDRKLLLEDLGSTNGTFVNGERITAKNLTPGDLITVGSTILRITPA